MLLLGVFSRLKNQYARIPCSDDARTDLRWWSDTLSLDFCGSKLVNPPPLHPTDISVDTSTLFGISLVIDGTWDHWRLIPGWKSDRRDIGWAEMVAEELGLLAVIESGLSNATFVLKSDNQGMIGALQRGQSRNGQQNEVLQRITALLLEHNLWITSEYVPSEANTSDEPSCGVAPEGTTRQRRQFDIPYPLRMYLHHPL